MENINLTTPSDMSGIMMQQKMNTVKSNINSIDKKASTFSKMLENSQSTKTKFDPAKLNKTEKKLYETCVEMESLLWKQVIDAMKKSTNQYKLLDGGMAEEIFSDMLYGEYSHSLAKNSSTGLAKSMYDQMSRFL